MISIRNVSKWYGSFQVLADCSTEVAKGEVVVVCGPSGSGKSTLIKCVNALEPFQQGTITVDGVSVGDPNTDLPKLRSRVGMVFQHFELFPHMTVTQNLMLAQIKVLQRSEPQAREKGLKLLERVGLDAHKDKFPGQLSGGKAGAGDKAADWPKGAGRCGAHEGCATRPSARAMNSSPARAPKISSFESKIEFGSSGATASGSSASSWRGFASRGTRCFTTSPGTGSTSTMSSSGPPASALR